MIIFLHGPDSFSSLEKLHQLKKKFQTEVDPAGSSIAVIEGNEVDLAYVRKVILAPALFAKERFVVFKNFLATNPHPELQKDVMALLQEYAGKKNDNIMLFWEGGEIKNSKAQNQILYKYLLKQKYSQEFRRLDNSQVISWVNKKIKQPGVIFAPAALTLFLESVGNDMWRVNSELQKLISYRGQGVISRSDVELLVAKKENENIYRLLDLLIAHNSGEALKYLNVLLAGEETESGILQILKWHLGAIIKIKVSLAAGMKNIYEIAKASSLHHYVIKKNKSYADSLSFGNLNILLELIIALEIDLRKEKAPPAVLLSEFIVASTNLK